MKKKDLLKTAKERFELCEQAWDDNRQGWLDDARFRAGEHWPEAVKKARENSNPPRPCLVVDKLNQYIRQVVNDGRMNRPTVKVRPVDDGADQETAEVFQGLIRHIWDRSRADDAIDTAEDCAVGGGFGFFRVGTEYAHENTFNQEIVIKRIRNPMTVLLDPNCSEADGSDARFGFVIDEIPKDEFKEKYPDAQFSDWITDKTKYSDGWLDEENVRVCEYFYKDEETKTLHLLADHTIVQDDIYQRAVNEGVPDIPEILESRKVPQHIVKWCRMSGAEILEEQDWPGKWIPIIPVYGNEEDIDGKVTYSGLIRAAKDPQRLYNYSRSAFAERVALTPKAPWVAADGQIEDYEEEWRTANTENHAVLRYKPTDVAGTPVPPPQRQMAADVPVGFAQDMQLSEHDIQSALGMYAASVGQPSNEKSGRAIMARQREGDTATFHYQDNLNRAIRHLGRILVDLAPKIYDSTRVIRIIGEDGSADMAHLDPTQEMASQKSGAKAIYNLGVGIYDVTVTAGPSYTTKRQEAADAMVQLTQANPALMQIIGDKMVRAMDWPEADEIADRLKLMLPPQIQQAEQKQGEVPPEVHQIMTLAEQAIQQREQALQEATANLQQLQEQVKELQSEHDIKLAEAQVKDREAEISAYDAETKRLAALSKSITPEQIQSLVVETIQQLLTAPDITQDEGGGPPQPAEQPPSGGFFVPEETPTGGQSQEQEMT